MTMKTDLEVQKSTHNLGPQYELNYNRKNERNQKLETLDMQQDVYSQACLKGHLYKRQSHYLH